jgi:hypothetical protein
MKIGEPTRFQCAECQIAFDIIVAPVEEWREQLLEVDEDGINVLSDAQCPFCGKAELKIKPMVDEPIQVDQLPRG